jgi:fatty-acid peroxygenase
MAPRIGKRQDEMSQIPRLKTADSTLALLAEGYEFIGRRCRRHGTDAFRTRIIGLPIVCMSGAEAAELFYGGDRFGRRRAMPRPTLTLLQDFGSVGVLDGEPHRHRKAMFMELMTRERVRHLAELSAGEWQRAIDRWSSAEKVVLEREARDVLCAAVCAWTAVPLAPAEVPRRAAELAALFDGAGSLGPRQVRGQLARRRVERWIEDVVEDARSGRRPAPPDTALDAIIGHCGLDGQPLAPRVAAVELINLLRPAVAVGRYVVWCALALHQHPEWRDRLRDAGDETVERFVQEVRRLSPFFPLVTGRAARDVEWRDHRFRTGDWVMLDIYGTNRDPRAWERPDVFDPDRFRGWEGDPFSLIPQGGGDFLGAHRCAGEWATIALLKVAVRALVDAIDYEVPDQSLRVALSRMPAKPASGFIIARVRRRP